MNMFVGLTIAQVITVIAITVLPSIFLFSLIMYSDRKSKEPFFFILLCSISGLFTITLALFIQNYLINAFSLGNIDNILLLT